MEFPAPTPEPPYYAVIFSSRRSAHDDEGYGIMAQRMEELAAQQPGFLGMESTRNAEGEGITISYWQTRQDIHAWGKNAEHRIAQAGGKAKWYETFRLRICRIDADRRFDRNTQGDS